LIPQATAPVAASTDGWGRPRRSWPTGRLHRDDGVNDGICSRCSAPTFYRMRAPLCPPGSILLDPPHVHRASRQPGRRAAALRIGMLLADQPEPSRVPRGQAWLHRDGGHTSSHGASARQGRSARRQPRPPATAHCRCCGRDALVGGPAGRGSTAPSPCGRGGGVVPTQPRVNDGRYLGLLGLVWVGRRAVPVWLACSVRSPGWVGLLGRTRTRRPS
jgi:hypothetical protein